MHVVGSGNSMPEYSTGAAATLSVKDRLSDQKDQFMIIKSVPKTTFDMTGQLEHGLVKLFTYFTESTYFSPTHRAHTSACSEMAQRF